MLLVAIWQIGTWYTCICANFVLVSLYCGIIEFLVCLYFDLVTMAVGNSCLTFNIMVLFEVATVIL